MSSKGRLSAGTSNSLWIRLGGLSAGLVVLAGGLAVPEPANARLQRFEGGFESIVEEVGIDLGGGDGGVPQRLLNGEDVGGAGVKRRGEGVPKRVGMHLLGDANFFDSLSKEVSQSYKNT